ncbi:MAG: GNAT family N-acetyltransferase [Candidatus Aenigmatarchaeota archaeon]
MKHPNGIIVKLNGKSISALADVDWEADHENSRSWYPTKSSMKKDITNRFKTGHEIFFGCKLNGKIVGYITLKPFFPGYKHCEVYWLNVKKSTQGHGIGTCLLKFIENYAKKKGFRKIFTYTGRSMKRTRKFYEKNGYKLVNEFPNYYSSGKDMTAVLYGKKLR